MTEAGPKCANCSKSAAECNVASLNHCAKCKSTRYCSRDCQRADWKLHKKLCANQANANAATDAYVRANTIHSNTYSTPHLNDLEMHEPKPFKGLQQGKYLHDRPEKDVYKLLTDSFRMRQQDDNRLENKTTPGSIYTDAASSIEPFRKYLAQAASPPGLLPPWWTPEKQKECEAFGMSGAWQDLRRRVTKEEVTQHYGDDKAPMQLRMLAEAAYGAGSMGQSGAGMLQKMVQMESGGPGGGKYMSMMDINNLLRGGS